MGPSADSAAWRWCRRGARTHPQQPGVSIPLLSVLTGRTPDAPEGTGGGVVERIVFSAARATVRALSRHGSVLCFHGLRSDADPVRSVMHLTLGAFQRLVALVRESAEVVPLGVLNERWERGLSTRGLVAVTFDDAYASLLETSGQWYLPAPFPVTVFVVTEASAARSAFWWDRLEALADALHQEDLAALEAACGMPGTVQERPDTVFGPLRPLRQWILARHRGRAPTALTEVIGQLELVHGRASAQRAMSVEELRRFARLGPVTYGVHTVTHPVLPLLPEAEALAEIRTAWETLRNWDLPDCIPALAAPFGLFDNTLPRLSAAAGMRACLVLNDRNLACRPTVAGAHPMPRWAMVEGTTRSRLAYRMTGLRDLVQGGSALQPPPLPGVHDDD